jgi:hypothetical protein
MKARSIGQICLQVGLGVLFARVTTMPIAILCSMLITIGITILTSKSN